MSEVKVSLQVQPKRDARKLEEMGCSQGISAIPAGVVSLHLTAVLKP
jgi:hypothetical protein